MIQIVKGAKEQQNNKFIPRTALPGLAVKNEYHRAELLKQKRKKLFWFQNF